jgi:hypothetical protein
LLAGCCAFFCFCRRIAAAIEEAGLKGKVSPLDYLQFFCLGKREATGTVCAVRQAGKAAVHWHQFGLFFQLKRFSPQSLLRDSCTHCLYVAHLTTPANRKT